MTDLPAQRTEVATVPIQSIEDRGEVDRAHEFGGDPVGRVAAAPGRPAVYLDPVRDNAEVTVDRGTTIIANEVVEKIAGIAAREVPGVHDLGGDVSRVFSAVKERIGLGRGGDDDQGVSVRLEGGRAAVKVTLVVEYGFVVYSVTEKVRANVIGAVENLIGLEVTAVDIVVDDVHVPESAPESAAPPNRSSVPNRPPI